MPQLEDLMKKGREALEIGEFAEAARAFRQAVHAAPGSAEAHELLAEALVEGGQLRDGIEMYCRARELDPDNVDLLFALGDAYFEVGQAEQALQTYQAIVDRQPQADAWVSMGLVHFNQERVEQAIDCYRRALQLEEDSVFALNSLGDAFFARGENETALDCYRRVIALDPEDAQAHFNLAELHYDLGDPRAAETECREALRLDPGLAFAYLTLGNLCLDEEKPREALHNFQQFLLHERSPGSKEIREEVAAVVEGLKAEL